MREQVRVCGRESAVGTATGSEAVPRRECRVGRKTRKWLARDGVRVRDERRRPARTSGPHEHEESLVGLAWGRVCKSARVSTCCLPLKGLRSSVVRLNGICLPELVCTVNTLFLSCARAKASTGNKNQASFLFLYFLKSFFTEIYFRFHNLQFCTPTARLRGGRPPATLLPGGRDLNINKIYF